MGLSDVQQHVTTSVHQRYATYATTHDISWNNCIGLGVENTSVKMGCRDSIKTSVLEKNPAIFIMGCPRHIVHNTALKAFEEVSCMFMFVLKILYCSAGVILDNSVNMPGMQVIPLPIPILLSDIKI